MDFQFYVMRMEIMCLSDVKDVGAPCWPICMMATNAVHTPVILLDVPPVAQDSGSKSMQPRRDW